MQDKIKIIHIITRLERGGSSQNVIYSAEHQALNGEIALAAGPCSTAPPLPKGVRYIELPDLKREISPLSDLKVFLKLKKVFSDFKPDIIHTHTSKAGFLGRLAAAAYNRRAVKKAVVVHTPHGHILYGYFSPLKTLIFTIAERVAARWTDRFIALSAGELEESAAAGFGERARWEVIHSGVKFPAVIKDRAQARMELGIGQHETVLGVIARLERVKGVEYFIRAAGLLAATDSAVKHPDLRFIVVGDGALMAGLRALAGSLGLGGRIIFTGFSKDIFSCLAAMDIYIQPSLNEAMGRTVLEAQYAGLPVIATRVCGLPDSVKEGETAILVPPSDPAALAAAAAALIGDRQKRADMGKAGRAWVIKKDGRGHGRFSAESMNAALENSYNKGLAERT